MQEQTPCKICGNTKPATMIIGDRCVLFCSDPNCINGISKLVPLRTTLARNRKDAEARWENQESRLHVLTIYFELPGLNEYTAMNRGKYGKYVGNREKQRTEYDIETAARMQLKGLRIKNPVVIHYHWVAKDRRKDRDNIVFSKKFIQDGLVKAGILRNDGWKDILGFTERFSLDPKKPRVEIIIEEVPGIEGE